ncbi:MAG TPA: PPOX class F420-dependent oxidoreductase [Dehalococcoidia bacterium]|nr:PPOX class F420-dependent oxidoreductase [Dehalococcoidia bacterium]
MAIPLSEGAKKALDGQSLAHVATLMKDGSPQVTPVWVYRHGDHVMISTGTDRIKTRNLERDPRVAVSIAPVDAPFPPILIRGRVIKIIRGEEAVDGFVEVAKKYGQTDPQRPPAAERVVYEIEATHCFPK